MEIEAMLSKASETLSVGRAFGPAIEQAGTVIIPVAMVAGGGGGGGERREETDGDGQSGGGFGGVTWPLGVYVVQEGKIRWVPAVDVTRILLAGLAIGRTLVKLRAARRLG